MLPLSTSSSDMASPSSTEHIPDIERGDISDRTTLNSTIPRTSTEEIQVDQSNKEKHHVNHHHHHYHPNNNKRSLLCEVEPLNYKDIGVELRGYKDLLRFAKDPNTTVMLDIKESTAESIIQAVLNKMIQSGQFSNNDDDDHHILNEAKDALLGNEFMISRNPNEENNQKEIGKHWHKNIQGPGFIIPFGKIYALNNSDQRIISIIRLLTPTNLGAVDDSLTNFIIVILTPTKESKKTKQPFELARSFASLLQDDEFFGDALNVSTSNEFKDAILAYLKRKQQQEHNDDDHDFQGKNNSENHKHNDLYRTGHFAGGLIEDIKRKYKWDVYRSDWTDGLTDPRSLLKYLSVIIWLYFAIIMPAIAFGALNDKNTKLPGDERGQIGVIETILSQAISGLVFSILAGQPLVIVMTTGPLTVFIQVLFSWSKSLDINFLPFYAWTGLWTAAILMVIVVTDSCAFIRFCGHFTEEIFATLIAAIFVGEFVKPLIHVAKDEPSDVFLLAFLLASGTYLVTHWLLEFRRSFLLKPIIRTLLSDFGVPISIIVMSALRRAFMSIPSDMLSVPDRVGLVTSSGRPWIVPLFSIKVQHIFLAGVSGFLLATLFFLDQNISSIMVNRSENKLKKGAGYHLDLAVVSLLVVFTSIFGMTWTHAALPHSPLHARALADVQEYEEHGRTYQRVVKARETRITAFLTHILIALSILITDVLGNIPMAVLYGFFLYMGIATLDGNPLWSRILLLFTSRVKYPPNHFVRRVPVKRIHLYTGIQVFLLIILWFVKSNFYLGDTAFNTGLLFPFVIVLYILVRLFVLPKMFRQSELVALESSE